eukprot:TRINITY_DN1943_c0_g2_i1.p1 TRINITY_DN1943_c0_g2~~TRINITY_DN1943_c0_g2_i1.p1  ORF type:complete len:515 (-),score=150.09 TRINITY_DN1943_c0_g2_i1:10-1554(-)
MAKLKQEIVTKNQTCADCNTPEPDVVSVGLGILICAPCSEVHKTLTIKSTIRGLHSNEPWAPGTLEFVSMLGNERANSIWEYKVPPEYKKPTKSDPITVREKWIYLKYQEKIFADGSLINKKGRYSKEVRNSIKNPNHTLYKEGWLVKKGLNVKSWKKRFFVLRDNYLFYYKTEAQGTPAGVISLHNASVNVSLTPVKGTMSSFLLSVSPDLLENFNFEVETPGRTYTFHAEDNVLLQEWVMMIQRNITWLKEHVTEEFVDPRMTVQQVQLAPERQGYLNKAIEKGAGVIYQRRWFVLQQGVIYYFKSTTDSSPMGLIDLKGSSIKIVPKGTVTQPYLKNSFELYTPNRTYWLYADSAILMREWVESIQSCIQDFLKKELFSTPDPAVTPTPKKPQVFLMKSVESMQNKVKEGWLYKRGEKVLSKDWKRRWFVVQESTLSYYLTNRDTIPKGSINLMTSKVVESKEAMRLNKFPFDIQTPLRRYHMYAETMGERDDWMALLEKVILESLEGKPL